MTAAHTPGPWAARRMHTGGFDIFDPRNRDVVTVYGGGVEAESREANARLIASAPDLLEALEDLLDAIGTHEPEWAWQERTNARAAIAKATGQ